MCVIIDANAAHQVFGDNKSEAGEFLLSRLSPRIKLAVGGGLLDELERIGGFTPWLRTALRTGQARIIPDVDVDAETDRLRAQTMCESNDHHVLALANISGARLLFTNDNALQDDFRNPRIIGGTRGRIYTTIQSRDVSDTHRDYFSGRWRLCDG